MTQKRRAKVLKVARAIVAGKTMTEAGMVAGFKTRNSASVEASKIANSPEGQKAIESALRAKGLTDDCIAEELSRGLKEGEIEGKHGEYLDRLIRLRGHDSKHEQPGGLFLINKALFEAERRGIGL